MIARRAFLSMTAGAVAARTVLPMAATASPSPDATLLAACAEAELLSKQAQEMHLPSIETDCGRIITASYEALHSRINAAHLSAAQIQAKTEAGRGAKARLVRTWLAMGPDMDLPHWANGQERLAWSLVNDLLAMGAG